MNRFFCCTGGLIGAISILLYALAYHLKNPFLAVVSPVLLLHAPIFIFLSSNPSLPIKNYHLAGIFILVGLLLFTINILFFSIFQFSLIPYLSVIGGVIMVIGWCFFPFFSLFKKRKPLKE